jgi:hypothetical protein
LAIIAATIIISEPLGSISGQELDVCFYDDKSQFMTKHGSIKKTDTGEFVMNGIPSTVFDLRLKNRGETQACKGYAITSHVSIIGMGTVPEQD